MKKFLFLASIISTVCFFSCSNDVENSFQEETSVLSLVSPNGSLIANSINDLNKRTADIIAEKFGDDYPFTIKAIEYIDVESGFLAIIKYELENGTISNYALSTSTDLAIDEGEVLQPLSPVAFKCSSASKCTPCQILIKEYTRKTQDGEEEVVREFLCTTQCDDCKLSASQIL